MLKKFLRFGAVRFQHEVAICCIIKNEDPYLPEWIDYHRKIGVTHFFLYDNESDRPVEQLLHQQVAEGLVTVERVVGKQMQRTVYRQCILQHGPKCRWIAFIDADEFIVPKTLTGNLPEFLMPYRKFGGLAVHWLVFGSSGHINRQTGQLHPYTKRLLKNQPINQHVKSIVQPRFVKTKKPPPDPHNFWYTGGRYCVNENYQRIYTALNPHTSSQIQLNHYHIRSLEEYKEKQARGNADDAAHIRKIEHFYAIDNDAVVVDEAILELLMIMEKG